MEEWQSEKAYLLYKRLHYKHIFEDVNFAFNENQKKKKVDWKKGTWRRETLFIKGKLEA